ncbi:MAG TPA: hypothetical protein VMU77_02155 [Acidimicrobiales bacterium]|nr:hypothetical protein [Acidimicrobiales bacterium]
MVTQQSPSKRRAARLIDTTVKPASRNGNSAVVADELPPSGYEFPILHFRLPEKVVDVGFWAALAGTSLVGIIDPPLAILIGIGVLVARHRGTESEK